MILFILFVLGIFGLGVDQSVPDMYDSEPASCSNFQSTIQKKPCDPETVVIWTVKETIITSCNEIWDSQDTKYANIFVISLLVKKLQTEKHYHIMLRF